MKQEEVTLGATYDAKVSGKIVQVRITRVHVHSTYGRNPRTMTSWYGVNLMTGCEVYIRGAQRLRRLVAPADQNGMRP